MTVLITGAGLIGRLTADLLELWARGERGFHARFTLAHCGALPPS